MKTFELTAEHVRLLQRANVSATERGIPGLDSKRPFGNGDWVSDMAEIVGVEPLVSDDGRAWPAGTADAMVALMGELETALQVVLSTLSFMPGKYVSDDYSRRWTRPLKGGKP